MASTYVNDLRLEEIADGEQSGTWGATTNTNLELIGEALGFGTEGITTNADTHTSTVADGAADAARAMYIKYTGTLDSACTITIAPNTLNRMHFIENGTSGSQNIIISQGSGANVTIPPGDTKAVYLDGAGSGAAVIDAFASLSVVDLKVQDDLTVTDDVAIGGLATVGGALTVTGIMKTDDATDATSTTDGSLQTDGGLSVAKDAIIGNDLKLLSDSAVVSFGADADVTLTHSHNSGLLLNAAMKLIFRDDQISIGSSADGDLSIAADDEIDLTSTLIDINGNATVSGTLGVTGIATFTDDIIIGDGKTIGSASDIDAITIASNGQVTLTQTLIGTALDISGNIDIDGSITSSDGMVITTADNTDTLKLISTDEDANAGPNLRMYRNSGSPADNDILGLTIYTGRNDNSQDVIYARQLSYIKDASDGTEDGQYTLQTMVAGTLRDRLNINPTEIVLNEDSQDLDFRVESNGNANMLVVNGGTESVQIGTNIDLITGAAVLTVNGQVEIATAAGTQCLDMVRGDAGLLQNFRKQGGSSVGNITISATATAFNTSSDYRLKENVVTSWDATTRLKQLKPSRFNFIADADTTVDGFLAHEVSSIVPEAVTGTKDATEDITNVVLNADGTIYRQAVSEEKWIEGKSDGTYASDTTWVASKTIPDLQSIDQAKLVPLLTKTILELEARITALENA